MTISVVIPALNEQDTIEKTLRLTTDLGFDEIIVVDGNSADQTRAVVESVVSSCRRSSRCTIRLLPNPPGRARQLNAGARAAGGDVLLFLHADTHLPPSARSCIESALADTAAVGGRFDVQFDTRSIWGYLISRLMNMRSRMTRITTGDQGLFVRSKVFHELGGFAEIPIMEDVEFSRRLKREGRTVALRDRVTTSFRRWEQQGPLRTIVLMWTSAKPPS